MMFHITAQETSAALMAIAAVIVVGTVLRLLRVIAYNTGRTSENVAEVLHLLRNRPRDRIWETETLPGGGAR